MICSMEGCNCNAVETPLFEKYYCFDCLCAFELIMDDMRNMELSE
jgi:hypothetical protein|tara:strand:+ start:814 stop:948 length:135 start_codon:yes stop_codon:yes gene_type:complete